MTLMITLWGSDKLPPKDHGEPTLMGCESARTELWGSSVMKSLSLELLPSLGDTDIHAYGPDALRLKAEAEKILDNLEVVSQSTGYGQDSIKFYCNNILAWVALHSRIADDDVGMYIG